MILFGVSMRAAVGTRYTRAARIKVRVKVQGAVEEESGSAESLAERVPLDAQVG